ncbi:hypothetical protein EXIGLDRAFT_676351 [Exidia glandulosa HHB12029]|uniref:ABC transporter domain-containing protein n=1 Tax=Exidia glandulosa HHB12029 TaxID=1314781 RepID=A0A165GYK0_EXIGL|nr:hypothetical protein EXIGLDRAFT_676351 [Exidia glandulosa HHB12029]
MHDDDQHQREEEIHELARQFTRLSRAQTQHSVLTQNPFELDGEKHPELDPSSSKFNMRTWIQTLVHLSQRDPDAHPGRSAGVSFRNLAVHGYGTPTDFQKDVLNVAVSAFGDLKRMFGFKKNVRKIQMHKDFRGEVIYNAETETHFPNLTVGETLMFAAKARAPRTRLGGVTRDQYARHMRDVVMAAYGLSHTVNTRVGNDFIRGVSGGERKRVSIAETTLSFAPIQCWDNSTRGLDSATALEFMKTLRLQSEYAGATSLVAIYQASQSAYDLFDKVIVLYEGRQIYFGKTTEAKEFFTKRGFVCAERQTTGDFLTSLTNPAERIVASGWENKVPRTADEFAKMWKESPERAQLLREIEQYNAAFPLNGPALESFRDSRRAQQSQSLSRKSPYTISYRRQVQLCFERGYQRLRGDMTNFYITVFGNSVMALIISSVFYNQQPTTASFFSRGALLFYAVLVNAFASALEILTLYGQRAVVEKHTRYALYRPSAEAAASMLVDMPSKIITSLTINLILYFMTNLRREPGAFFLFLLMSFTCTITMSMIFRTIGSSTRTLSQAMPGSSLMILAMVIYTGFAIPIRDMVPWFRWINYINPIAYAFENLMVNEFHGREFTCVSYSPSGPGYENASGDQILCNAIGAAPGASMVSGTDYVRTAYHYEKAHFWRNYGILVAFIIFFLGTYLFATEIVTAKKSKGEVLVFPRGHLPKSAKRDEEEAGDAAAADAGGSVNTAETLGGIQRQTRTFHWSDVCYDITIKGEPRRILDHVDGWVKPGTLTALMGVSGAGKTTLLDVLATRVTMGVITGEMLVNGRPRDQSFQRKTGYVQQQDLHLETSTVREALEFSAILRQSDTIPREEKIAYVDEVIRLLEMETYADAVVGVPGEGLNVEQRKRLTIAVELVAKPELLLFFDEPTSGLDSQTAWSICQLMRKLANNGQAILCTIHQPSAVLIQEFDRLLFLAKGGKTVYFGDMGKNSSTLVSYFEKNGAHACPPDANPAEWMLEVIGAAPGSVADRDWHEVWNNSPERADVKRELAEMKATLSTIPDDGPSPAGDGTYATSMKTQFWQCYKRVNQQYWRSPTYIYSKIVLCLIPALFIGFSFYKADNSQQGLQNQMFAVFSIFMVFSNLVQQIHPMFVAQRSLYEARERPAKTYSWVAFMLSQILVEFPWMVFVAMLTFFSWYYPIGLYRNAIPTGAVHERGALMFLYLVNFFIFTGTFAHLTIVTSETAEAGSNMANLMFSLSLLFCGVLANSSGLGWWVWMYRVSPFTYYVSGILATAVANAPVVCSDIEFILTQPPAGMTCGDYMGPFLSMVGGTIQDANATSNCRSCLLSSTNQFLAQINSNYGNRWRDWGIDWIYIIFNIAAACFLYWLARVPRNKKDAVEVAPTAAAPKSIAELKDNPHDK